MHKGLLIKAQKALAQIEPMASQGWPPAESIARQLRWCVDFASGQLCEERPGAFSMGLIATRELDMYGDMPELASLINQVQREVESTLARQFVQAAEPGAAPASEP
jgi:hypothetical protein